MSFIIHELNAELICSKCEYKEQLAQEPGQSIGNFLDALIVRLLNGCPVCKGQLLS